MNEVVGDGGYRDYREKVYEPERWCHVWNRGFGVLFRDDVDRRVFLACLARFLSPEPALDSRGRPLRWLFPEIHLGGYCLLSTHFHLLVRTGSDPDALRSLMHCVKAAYAREFRARHGAKARVFRDRYEADLIEDAARLARAAVYVHLNFRDDPDYTFSSHRYLAGTRAPVWLNGAEKLLDEIGGIEIYHQTLERERRRRAHRKLIKARRAAIDEEIINLHAEW